MLVEVIRGEFMAEKDAYDEALKSGQYQKPGGLRGKYDNVRRFWEDEQIGLYLRPYLERLVAQKKKRGEGLRILDLGCGSGDGFELVTAINDSKSLISGHSTKVIRPDILDAYQGIDINEGLLRQAQAIYKEKQNISFSLSDFNDCKLLGEQSYDLYLANYGTLSHNSDEQTVELLSNIINHSNNGAIILVDWLGRFSYEWQTLWTADCEHNQWIDYAISYIYSGNGVRQPELTYFPLRIMGRSEVMNIYQQVRRKTEDGITLRKLADRSSFVGRHMDTTQYNPHCQPLRRMVNSLFEPNLGTNLDELLVHYIPRQGFDEVNNYYQWLTTHWNYIILYTKALLEPGIPPEAPSKIPIVARRAISTMGKIVKTAASTRIGNPRASLVEPQLGYCLREIEMELQEGLGCGHGLVAIFEIVK